MFQVGDSVIYGSAGICQIAELAKMDFGTGAENYYVLRQQGKEDSAVYVPIANERLVRKMRNILPAEEINELMEQIPKKEPLWFEDESERKTEYKKIIDSGERESLIRIIKALAARQQKLKGEGKKLHVSDERFLKEAEGILCSEVSYTLKITDEQAHKLLHKQVSAAIA